MEAQDRYIKEGQILYRLKMKDYLYPVIYLIKITKVQNYGTHLCYEADDKKGYFTRDIGNLIFYTYEEAEEKGKEKVKKLENKKQPAGEHAWRFDRKSYIQGRKDERENLKKRLRQIYEEEIECEKAQ